jgi:putative colanic acid biosynthesis UDP-glucose lipid carrier transferase
LLLIPFLFLSRILFYYSRKYFAQNDDLITKVAIIGYNDTARKLADYLEDDLINTRLVGYFANNYSVTELTNYPILSDLSAAIQTASTHQVQEIYSTISPEDDKEIYKLMLESEKSCIRFKFVPSLNAFYKKPFHTQFYNDLPILSPFPDPLDDPGNRFKKRVFDLTVAFFVIIFILSWLLPLLSVLIYLESGGPIFFLQKRTGKSDKPFNCFKFRTMFLNPDKEHVQAKKHDIRVTKIGSILRKTSLDEFPQFINVLFGQMSVVGPRPHMISHTQEFSQLVDHYMVRQLLKPGITGWAQVNGYRGEITHPDQLKMRVSKDLWYLENWSVWLDFRIIVLTATGLFKEDKHAY